MVRRFGEDLGNRCRAVGCVPDHNGRHCVVRLADWYWRRSSGEAAHGPITDRLGESPEWPEAQHRHLAFDQGGIRQSGHQDRVRSRRLRLHFEAPLHCFNLTHVIRELQKVPDETEVLRLHFSPLANVVDHTAAEQCSTTLRTTNSAGSLSNSSAGSGSRRYRSTNGRFALA